MRTVLAFVEAAIVIGSVDKIFIPMLRSELIIDQYSISGHTGELRFEIPWRDIVAIWQWKSSSSIGNLYIGTIKGSVAISVYNFNEKIVWQALQTFARPEVIADGSYRRSNEYQKVIEENRQSIDQIKFPLQYQANRWVSIAGWVLFCLFLALTIFFMIPVIMGIREFLTLEIPFFVLWLVSIIILLIYGYVEIDPIGITHKNRLGSYYIKWDEVTRLETDESSSWFIFYGDGKRLSMPGTRYWSGQDRDKAVTYIVLQLEEREAPVEINPMAPFKLLSKNTYIG